MENSQDMKLTFLRILIYFQRGECSQKEGQDDQGEVKELRGTTSSCFKIPWSSWPSFWLFPRLSRTPSRDLRLWK